MHRRQVAVREPRVLEVDFHALTGALVREIHDRLARHDPRQPAGMEERHGRRLRPAAALAFDWVVLHLFLVVLRDSDRGQGSVEGASADADQGGGAHDPVGPPPSERIQDVVEDGW